MNEVINDLTVLQRQTFRNVAITVEESAERLRCRDQAINEIILLVPGG